ncbi:MAG: bifunctional oligoribonuclease/PAP phosphatase NrnA [Anaerolineae bacterium]
MDSTIVQKIKAEIEQASEILVTTHIGPDGDALGSLTAVGQMLHAMGKQFDMICDDGILRKFEYLPLAKDVRRRVDRKKIYDLLIAVDCGDEQRMGYVYSRLTCEPLVINIDHHISNNDFGHVNLVVADTTSTAEILANLIPMMGVPLDKGIATSLLTGMVTDTLGFRVTGVTAKTLKIAGELIAAGADMAEIMLKALVLQELNTIKMWSKGLNKMEVEDGVAWAAISLKDQQAISDEPVSNHGLGNMISDIHGVAMSAVFTEKDDGEIRIGFRSRPPWDVATLATKLGGGGHRFASGCSQHGPLEDVVQNVVTLAKETIAQQKLDLKN